MHRGIPPYPASGAAHARPSSPPAPPSCSNTAFNVTTGVAATLGLGAGAMGFDLAACGLFGDRLSGRGFLAGSRAGGHGYKLACGGDTDANHANRPPGKGGLSTAARPC